MKTLVVLATFLSGILGAQSVNYEKLSEFLGNRVYEFEDYYKIKSDKVEDNFGNLTVDYKKVTIDDKTFDIVLTTEGKNINHITLSNSADRTKYFAEAAKDLEKNTEVKKNYKTLFVSIVKKQGGKKIFFDNVTELMKALRDNTYDLTQWYGLVESQPLKTNLTIDSEKTLITIK